MTAFLVKLKFGGHTGLLQCLVKYHAVLNRHGLVFFGVLALIVGLIAMFPARVAVHWFAPAEVSIGGLQGTAWAGTAKQASVSGLSVRDIQWDLNPLRLFTGELSYTIVATPVSGFFESDISIGFGDTISLTNLTAAVPLNLFANASGVPGLRGNASVTFERLTIVGGLAVAADGIVKIADLVIPIVGRDSLGGYQAEFFTQNNGIAASIEDTDGVLDLAGSLQIRTDRSFEFIAQVAAKPETPQSIRQQLQFLPPANDRGQQELRLEGIL